MGETALLSSDQPHEAAPGCVWWFDAAISRYHKKNAFLCVFFTCSQKNIFSTAEARTINS